MRYARLADIVRLARLMQGPGSGLTLDQIESEFEVGRRTAERMRDAVEDAFGPLMKVRTADRRIRWRLTSGDLGKLIRVTPEMVVELASAAEHLERSGLSERTEALRSLADKLRAFLRPIHPRSKEALEAELEALMQAEGLAMRPGPRQKLEEGLLVLVREAIKVGRLLEFDYLSWGTGKQERYSVRPYGVLYGNRALLVAQADWADDIRLWRLANVANARLSDRQFARDPAFDLGEYAQRAFGAFQEEPMDVVLRFAAGAAADAANFLFHPSQTSTKNDDETLTVRFTAGGLNELCWHLFTWGESVRVEKPARLRRALAEMCARIAAHHSG